MTHSCIKCKKLYESADPDAYYCATCFKEKQAIAAQIDEKFKHRDTTPVITPLQEYDQAQKVRGFIKVTL